MRAITFPFKNEKCEQAFRWMLSTLGPEDQDEFIRMHNNRDPVTGISRPVDSELSRCLIGKVILAMMLDGVRPPDELLIEE